MNPTDSHAPLSVYDGQLRELIEEATQLAGRARRARLDWILRQLRAAGHTLHAARDLLDQIGAEYIDAARAYISAGAKMLQDLTAQIDRAEIIPDDSKPVTADDVLSWCEHVGLDLLPWQIRFLERRLSA